MKKILNWVMAVSLILTLCLGLASCKLIFPDQPPVHSHSYQDGKCECGETDPNYVPPHQHSFVGGVCECGEIDPNHECIFFEGKCIICSKDDPNPNYVITGDYGVTAEVVGNCTVTVNTVDTKSDEYEDLSLTLEEGSVNILDKAWVMYNVTIQPEDEEGEVKFTTGKVSVPTPVPGVEEYLVYEVQETKVEEIEYELVNDYIVVNTWNYNYNYLVTTEQSFNVVEYYEKTDTQIPEHINVGEDKAEDAYQKGQTRTLEVYACINGLKLADADNYSVMVDGYIWSEYNTLGKEVQYQQMVHLSATPNFADANRTVHFIGWYVGDFNEEDKIVLEDIPYYTDLDLEFEMPAEDLKLFAVYAIISNLRVTGNMSRVSVDGDEFYDYVSAKVNPLQKYITLSVEPLENCYFSHWAYEDDPYNPECFISDEPTFVYEIPEGQLRGIVAVCEPYSKYEYSVYSVCSEPIGDSYGEYRFIVNGEDYNDDYYSGTFWEYQTFRITAVPVKGCKFVGWAVISLRENETYDSCKDKISSTDATYIINKDNCSTFKNNKLVAVYEMLPHHDLDVRCYYADDNNYGSFASIYVNGQSLGSDSYSTMLAEGEQITVKVVPEMNCKFEGWYYFTVNEENFTPILGELASSDPEFTFTVGKENIGIIAKLRCYPTYSVSAYAGEGGDIYINGENHYGSIRHAYEEGEKLTVKIDVKEGFEFKGWYVNSGTHEQLITTDHEFEYTVGSSDASFLAKLEPIIYYNVKLEIKSPALTVDIDDYTDLSYIPETEVYRVYVTMRREGDSVTIRAKDVEGESDEFSHWVINGKMIGDREYTFTVGTEDVTIYAVSRPKVDKLELKLLNNLVCRPVYSTNYETGERYISAISINVGAIANSTTFKANIFQGLTLVKHGVQGQIRYVDVFAQCDFDFGGAAKMGADGIYYFDNPGTYTVTITDKSNPEISISFTLQVLG